MGRRLCELEGCSKLNRNVRDFGREIAHATDSRRPPISLAGIVARTRMCARATRQFGICPLVQGPFSVAPRQTLLLRFGNFCIPVCHYAPTPAHDKLPASVV
jgi:hypothetical protein